jgi:hypothetical protein
MCPQLAVEFRPVQGDGSAGIGGEVRALARAAVRVEAQPAVVVDPAQEHEADRWRAGRIGRRERQRVGQAAARGLRLGHPAAQLRHRIGIEIGGIDGHRSQS